MYIHIFIHIYLYIYIYDQCSLSNLSRSFGLRIHEKTPRHVEGAPQNFQSQHGGTGGTQVSLVVSWWTPKMPGKNRAGGVKPHVIFNPMFFWRDLESWLKVGRKDFFGEIDRQSEKHHRKKILTIFDLGERWGIFRPSYV